MKAIVDGKQLLRAIRGLQSYVHEDNDWPYITLSMEEDRLWASAVKVKNNTKSVFSAFHVKAQIEDPEEIYIDRSLEQILHSADEGDITFSTHNNSLIVEGPQKLRARMQRINTKEAIPLQAFLERITTLEVVTRFEVDKASIQKILNLSMLYPPHPTAAMRWVEFDSSSEGLMVRTQGSETGEAEMELAGVMDTYSEGSFIMQTEILRTMVSVCPSSFLLRAGATMYDPIIFTGIGEDENMWYTGAAQVNIERTK